jgi:hypothetical protein
VVRVSRIGSWLLAFTWGMMGDFVGMGGLTSEADQQGRYLLEYAPAPVDNPLKGLVPYQGDYREYFPHSMEFNYLPYSALVKGYNEFDWVALEKMLNDIAGRGHQAVFRICLEYPGGKGLIPDFLIRDGLKIHRWWYSDGTGRAPVLVETPDYEDNNLRKSLKSFITALGRKYDGDPRIGFITAGLLGLWGEWHTYPKVELFASKTVQVEVMDAYEAVFKVTPVLVRYPVGEKSLRPDLARNVDRPFGYHDDSFAWATLHTGRRGDEWFFMTALKAAGAEEKWKTRPIGGEIRPEAWGIVFDEKPRDKRVQDFLQCVEATHVSWLMDSGMFQKKQNPDRIQRAMKLVRRMGYEFHCRSVSLRRLPDSKLMVQLEIVNRGVAPFYYTWKGEWGPLMDGKPVKTIPVSDKLTGLLPEDTPRIWSETLELSGLKPGLYELALRVPNPLKNGHPLKFANKTQDADATGWLTLSDLPIN